MENKTFKPGQLVSCDQLNGPWPFDPKMFDKEGYMEIIGFGKVHINNFKAYHSPSDGINNEILTIPRDAIVTFHSKQSLTPISYFEELINDNYSAVKARGLITKETDFHDFMEKLDEETQELANAYVNNEGTVDSGELIDCICVLLNMAKHYRIDIIQGLKNNAVKNWDRAKHINLKEL
jgi:NTP pyrophosphatase (non-canonical NTP hydrolase)